MADQPLPEHDCCIFCWLGGRHAFSTPDFTFFLIFLPDFIAAAYSQIYTLEEAIWKGFQTTSTSRIEHNQMVHV